jgi:hypothetical protein
MILEQNAIVPEALNKKVGWDMRHHFMAENVLGGVKGPPE